MKPTCMFEILELPAPSLRRILPRASSRSLVRLISAYPRTAGRVFLTILDDCFSPATLQFFREQVNGSQTPSLVQIRDAEQELVKIIHDEQLELA